MKRSNMVLSLGVLLAGCALDEEKPADESDSAEVVELSAGDLAATTPEITAAEGYSGWRFLEKYNPYASISFRLCKTSTRINWQFTGNYYFNKVNTYGDTIPFLTSNIGGVVSGSHYRSRNNAAWFVVWFQGLAGELWNQIPIYTIPDC